MTVRRLGSRTVPIPALPPPQRHPTSPSAAARLGALARRHKDEAAVARAGREDKKFLRAGRKDKKFRLSKPRKTISKIIKREKDLYPVKPKPGPVPMIIDRMKHLGFDVPKVLPWTVPVKPKKEPVRQLHKKTSAKSLPVKKPTPPKKPKPKKPEPGPRGERGAPGRAGADAPRRTGTVGRGTGTSATIAPVQQVTVAAPQTAGAGQGGGRADNSELIKKINELLKAQKDSKRKKEGNKAYNAAKKEYRNYRKRQIAVMNKQNKDIKKRELAKIRRMPTAVRGKMRKQLAEKLKQRADSIKSRLPSKITSPAQLRELLKGGPRTLTV